MSRSLFLAALLAGVPALPAAWGQNVHTLDPALTIRVARDEQAVNDPTSPGAVVSGMALSPDGRTLAAVGDDHLVRTFSLPDGRRLHELAGHQRWVRGAAFSGDGQSLVTADEERKIIFWDLATRKPKQELNS